MEREAVAYTLDKVEFLVEVDGSNLEFDTAKAFFQFLFHALEHLVVVAHPDEAVDGNAYLTTTKSGVKHDVAMLQIEQGGLKSK